MRGKQDTRRICAGAGRANKAAGTVAVRFDHRNGVVVRGHIQTATILHREKRLDCGLALGTRCAAAGNTRRGQMQGG